MMEIIKRYSHWLHTQWPAGEVEKLPVADENGETNIPGLFITGDLTGIPLLKFAIESGARCVQTIHNDPAFQKKRENTERDVHDLAIVGAGVSGCAAAIEAKKRGLSFVLIEAARPFATIHDFPKGKPIFTYPKEMTPSSDLQVNADVKEALVDELEEQFHRHGIEILPGHVERIQKKKGLFQVHLTDHDPIQARRCIVAIGKGGHYRKLGVPGEDLDKVYHRLHDPKDYADLQVLVVGGGDSALETTIALVEAGAEVTLSYRGEEWSRPKPENVERLQSLAEENASNDGGRSRRQVRVALETRVEEIRPDDVVLVHKDGRRESIPNDVVFLMLGREAPLDFFRRCKVRIQGEWTPASVLGLVFSLLLLTWLCLWKSSGNPVANLWYARQWFPFNLKTELAYLIENPKTLLGTLSISMTEPGFHYGLVYSIVVLVFGILRIRRRRTPYVTWQTWTVILIQIFPLFLLPYVFLPWLGHNGLIPVWINDAFFPEVDYGHGRAYWRSFGLILAWPLFLGNVFSSEPMWGWLILSLIQTFVLIPWLVYRWGKGAYCGWICSCGALAETLGDTHRAKMVHGAKWNRLNLAGQAILLLTFVLLGFRVLDWFGIPLVGKVFYFVNDFFYKFFVEIFLSGILGIGLYFWFSGRVWCRFFCPLAALMHIYARFSRFRILPEKKKCISCNICTAVCHQGIDVMNFANKGRPMEDPECVRCSACVQSCPTGVLSFGEVDSAGRVVRTEKLPASPVRMRETT